MSVRNQKVSWVRLSGCAVALAAVGWLAGCATPGPPKAPSLQIPAMVTGLEAVRRGDTVELRFELPTRTTDNMPFLGKTFHVAVCRAVESGTCMPVGALSSVAFAVGGQERGSARDVLPPELTVGAARLLTYRVKVSNDRGRTAGYSEAAYSAAGAAPGPVAGLRAEGARQGVAVRWASLSAKDSGAVVLRREVVGGPGASKVKSPAAKDAQARSGSTAPQSRERGHGGKKDPEKSEKEEPGVVWLSTSPKPDPLSGEVHETAETRGANGVLDDGAMVGDTYRYAAERQVTAQFGGHTVVLHSGLSAPVEVTLQAMYPPPAPTDLAGTLFPLPATEDGKPGGFAVDLIWTPADDPKTVGYNIVRTWIEPGHAGEHSRTKLNDALVKTPSFHDVLPSDLATAANKVVFVYYVTAVDANGLESAFVSVVVGK